jgi:hypothetical protein
MRVTKKNPEVRKNPGFPSAAPVLTYAWFLTYVSLQCVEADSPQVFLKEQGSFLA